MTRKRKPVPPTPFYLSKRAELFRREAVKAEQAGEKSRRDELLKHARKYAILAGELDLDTEGTHEEHVH